MSVTAPANGSNVVAAALPKSITITANAVAPGTDKVVHVKFYVDGVQVATVTKPAAANTYSFAWSAPAARTYQLKAVAQDAGGVSTTASSTVTITLTPPPNVLPLVSLNAPAGPFTAPATIALTANASDSDGTIANVKFYEGATLIGTSLSPISGTTYGTSWSGVTAGTHTVNAVATDNAGGSTTSASVVVTVNPASPATQPLVQPADLVYQGAFRVPDGIDGVLGPTIYSTFQYGGTALAFNPSHNSLFMVGHDAGQLVAEVGIPAAVNSNVITDLNTASVLQPFADPTGGTLSSVNPGGQIKIGGLLAYNDRLYVSAYTYYDGLNTQATSHFVTDQNLSLTNVNGPYQVGPNGFCLTTNSLCAGFVDGYMARVPPEWQSALGGPVLTGQCCLAVVSRTSWGPAAVTIDPAQLGLASPLPIAPQVFYPMAHPTLGVWDSSSLEFNGSSEVTGLVFPQGTRSLLFFGRHGVGAFCYGSGTADPAQAGLPTGDGAVYCYDPTSPYKGVHAYPYVYYVWAYDATHLAGVAGGNPWDVTPYAVWQLNLPFSTDSDRHILGAAYDPATNRIFVSQAKSDSTARPLIHVFSVQIH